MSTPLTPDQIRAALRKWGIRFHEYPGWETWNRNGAGWPWGPVHGFVLHHTGDDAPDDADEKVVHDGRADLPGPLAQFGIRDDGSVDLLGCGRANHAGGGDPRVLDAVIAESYGDYPPAPHYHQGSPGAADGNTVFYGAETYYSGSHRPEQYATMVLLPTAIMDAHGWGCRSTIGHKEWSDWKPDPASVDMKQVRADIEWCLKNGPAAAIAKFGGGAPAPAPTEGDEMAGFSLDAAPIVVGFEKMPDGKTDDPTKPIYWNFGHKVRHLAAQVSEARAAALTAVSLLQQQGETLDAIVKAQAAIQAGISALGDHVGVSADDLEKLSAAAEQAVTDAINARVRVVDVASVVASVTPADAAPTPDAGV